MFFSFIIFFNRVFGLYMVCDWHQNEREEVNLNRLILYASTFQEVHRTEGSFHFLIKSYLFHEF